MKSVSAAFKAEQAKAACISLRRVSYKRRYWVQTSQSYTWEESWTTLDEGDVVSVSPITAKLDTEAVNEFKISNVTLVLKNADRKWSTHNPFGRFGKDAGSPVLGYEPYWTKFRIETGYTVAGVDTYTPLFVGVAVDFKTDGYSDSCQISVQGLEALLQNANAENVSTLVTNETPTGTVNGTNKDFVTLNPGVGIIVKVTIDGVEKKAGTEYSESDLDTPTLGAKITFTNAPTVGQVVKVTYRYWKQNRTIQSLVSDLLLEAGIGLSSQTIDTVVFGNAFELYADHTSSDWSLSTKTDTTTSLLSPSLSLDAESATFLSTLDTFSGSLDPAWSGQVSIVSGKLRVSLTNANSGEGKYLISGRRYGQWEYKFTLSHTDITTFYTYIDGMYSFGYYSGAFRLGAGSYSWTPDTSQHTVKLVYFQNNTVDFYFDGTKRISAATATPTNDGYFKFSASSSNSGRYIDYDDLKGPPAWSGLTGSAITKSFDLTSAPASFTKIVPDGSTSPGTVGFETSTSPDNSTWSSWVATDSNLNIQSTPNRYIRFRVTLNETDNNYSPYITSFRFKYLATSTLILLAKFTGQTVYSAIQSLGSFSNYEWGFKEDETFFFRSKGTGQSINETLDTSTNLVDVSAINNGYDRVYHEVQAEYGSFSVTMAKGSESYSSPSARFGKRRLTISNADILLAQDTDIATGVATGLLSFYSVPRRTCKAKTKLMEWLDLSDTITVNFRDNPGTWWLGDGHVYMGESDIYLHGPEANTLDGFLAKVVGYRHDTENKVSEFDLEEIVS